jgi:hypothetical protein
VIETKKEQLSGIVNIYQALGGGAAAAPPPPDAAPAAAACVPWP